MTGRCTRRARRTNPVLPALAVLLLVLLALRLLPLLLLLGVAVGAARWIAPRLARSAALRDFPAVPRISGRIPHSAPQRPVRSDARAARNGWAPPAWPRMTTIAITPECAGGACALCAGGACQCPLCMHDPKRLAAVNAALYDAGSVA